ncbi:integrator complex subunit 8-like isoform X1 [Sycon ciliatum]|uniref:integrator complex subunit 8-like isoform X1 n=2 Tax=Sycon ciliatum TaxID=27933 RepID=UPI0031F71EA6
MMDPETVRKKYGDLPHTWFEFLFDHALVVKHLTLLDSSPNSDPSACQMISAFMEKISSEALQESQLACAPMLRQLALYVAGWLKWNLMRLMASVSFASQVGLLEALQTKAQIQLLPNTSLKEQSPAAAMVHILFARWVVKSVTVHLSRSAKVQDSVIANSNQMENVLQPLLPYAINILQCAVDDKDALDGRPLFLPVLELSAVQAVGGDAISALSIRCQVCSELGQLLFQEGKFAQACVMLQRAKEMISDVADDDIFCIIDRKILEANLLVCLQVTEPPNGKVSVALSSGGAGNHVARLVMKTEQCRRYGMLKGMDSVLMDASGGALAVPPPYKCDLEDSLALTAHRGLRSVGQPSPTGSVAASSTDPTAVDAVEMNWRVSACNAVHNTVLGMPVSPSFWVTWYQAESKEHVMYLLDVCLEFLKHASSRRAAAALHRFATVVCQSSRYSDSYMHLLQKHALASTRREVEMEDDCNSAERAADAPARKSSHDSGRYPWADRHSALNQECQLLSSSKVEEMRSLLQDLQRWPTGHARFGLSEWWNKERHGDHLLSVLLVKANHLQQAKSFTEAEQVLGAAWQLAEALHPATVKNDVLRRLSDSQLSLDIQQYLAIQRNDQQRFVRLIRGTKDFLHKASTTPAAATAAFSNPLLEACCIFLTNVREAMSAHDLLVRLDLGRASKTVQLCHALMATMLAISTNSGQDPRKPARILFEQVSELLIQPTQHKRSSEGLKKESLQRAKAAEAKRMVLLDLAKHITEPVVLSVLVSCLVRIHTALVLHESGDGGDSKSSPTPKIPDISCQHPLCWPVAVNSPSNMVRSEILLMLQQILDHCLSHHPNHPGFMCTAADVLVVSQHYTSALKLYMSLGAAHSNFFTTPVPVEIWTDQVYRSMITCCQGINAFTQATVLCQLLTPVDYQLANHCIQQTNCFDAMEFFYDCIWDLMILEYAVHTHTHRGEEEKRQVAVNNIGDPDLNTANSAETIRKAVQIRLTKFLRRMATLYI